MFHFFSLSPRPPAVSSVKASPVRTAPLPALHPPFLCLHPKAQLSAGPTTDAAQHSRKATGSAAADEGWDFPELLVTSEALAAEMLSQSIIENADGRQQGGGEQAAGYTRSSSMPPPPPPDFRLDEGDIGHYR